MIFANAIVVVLPGQEVSLMRISVVAIMLLSVSGLQLVECACWGCLNPRQLRNSIIYAPQLIVRAQVLLREMATLLKVFQKQSLPMSNEVELPDAVRREVNSAVQKVFKEERNGASGRK